jgi:hypothetical protein
MSEDMVPDACCWLVVNPASGSNDAISTEAVVSAIVERGWQVDRVIAFPDEDLPDPAVLDVVGIRHGERALRELAKRRVLGVLPGHAHDACDIAESISEGAVRMIGAGKLSQRTRSTPPGFNQLHWDGARLEVTVRNVEQLRWHGCPGRDCANRMQAGRVPERIKTFQPMVLG